ncbi:MAG: efflux RND transporter periplasmic adaptor subunit [Steroidobacteraceae bacterium]
MRTHIQPLLRQPPAAKVLLALALATALALQGCGRAPGAGQPAAVPAAMTVTTTQVAASPIAQVVEATGSIQAWQDVIISAEVGGYRISQVLVDVGTAVQKGQVLVRLAGDMLQADLDSRRAALRSAEASEINAAAALRRGESVATQGALSAADLDRLRAEHVDAAARVETARADLRTAELRVRYATVTAPDSGVITSRTVSVGQIAQAGTEMLRLLRQNRVEWQAQVPEAQMRLIKVGQKAEITTVDGARLEGTVRAVSPTVQPTTRIGIAYVDIVGGAARPGMFARGRIQTGEDSALLLPVASIVMQDGYSYVFVLKDGNTVERRRVQPVGVHGDRMQVSGGVAAGEKIAVTGAGFLKDGDTVRIADTAAAQQSTP